MRFWNTKYGIAFYEKCCNFINFSPIPYQNISNERSFIVESKFRWPDNKIISPSPISAFNISKGLGGGRVKPGHPPKYSLICLVLGDDYKNSISTAKKKLQALLCKRGSYFTPSYWNSWLWLNLMPKQATTHNSKSSQNHRSGACIIIKLWGKVPMSLLDPPALVWYRIFLTYF